ncbi:MAG: NfeD family protein [Candidatus Ozemobacteraceae bacterium]
MNNKPPRTHSGTGNLSSQVVLLLGLSVLMTLFSPFRTPLWVSPCAAQELSDGELIPKKASDSTSPSSPHLSPASASPSSSSQTTKSPSPAPSSLFNVDSIDELPIGMIVAGSLLAGLILLFIEVALIPGFGVTGVTGIVSILAGMGLAFWKLSTGAAVLYTFTSLGALIGLVLWSLYVFPHTALGKKFVLNTKISVEDGYTATQDFSHLVGQEGVAASDLRPSGVASIAGQRLDVVSEGDFIPRGTKIRAVRQKNTNLVVIAIEETRPETLPPC